MGKQANYCCWLTPPFWIMEVISGSEWENINSWTMVILENWLHRHVFLSISFLSVRYSSRIFQSKPPWSNPHCFICTVCMVQTFNIWVKWLIKLKLFTPNFFLYSIILLIVLLIIDKDENLDIVSFSIIRFLFPNKLVLFFAIVTQLQWIGTYKLIGTYKCTMFLSNKLIFLD